ncbi:hypothetical protein ATERTT37_007812 [Aspergillus terreus]
MVSTSQHSYVRDLLTGPPPTRMTYNRLGKSGLKVSSIILGAMSFGSKDWQKWVLEEDEALPLLGYAYEVGINTWDTVSWKLLSYFLDSAMSNVVLMTKCRSAISASGEPQLSVFASTVNDGRLVNRAGLSRKHILDAAQASVKRLGTYIDVFQIQRIDPDVPREEIMKALNDVVEMGLARYIGASSWSPVARGILARPWNRIDENSSLRSQHDAALTRLYSRESQVEKAIVEIVEEIANERGVPMAVIATAWCLAKGVNPIVGLNSKDRIDDAVLAAKTILSEREIARLESAYQPRPVTGY